MILNFKAWPAALLVVLLALAAGPAFAAPDEASWHRLIGLLQYLQSDYPLAASSADADELAEQKAFAAEAVTLGEQLGAPAARFVPDLKTLQQTIDAKGEPAAVSAQCKALVDAIVAQQGLARSPRHPPDLEQGKALYAQSCASCHGLDGKAKTEAAAKLNPPPANFTDPVRMGGLSPYKVFNAVGFGLKGTAMPPFPTLSDEERWSLAFYVMSLRHPLCVTAAPKVSLETLATTSDDELARAYGATAAGCLRRTPPHADEEASLLVARDHVQEALALAEKGEKDGARQKLIDAYLQGVEPVEPLLRARQPDLVPRIEEAFGEARLAANRGPDALRPKVQAVTALLDEARRGGAAKDFWSVYWFAALILLREGFEALVLVGALLAVFKKTGQRREARAVHAGWLLALVAGAASYLFFARALAGANREVMEGVVALVAVGMLLYAALWLNARKNVRRFMGEVREQLVGASAAGSRASVFGIAFAAVFREAFETAIFLQGLAIDSQAGATWGALTGIVFVVLLVLAMDWLGVRLPMQTLFNASTFILLGTAVVLMGKGVHALQEVGFVPERKVPFVEVELLGVFPDLMSLLPQLVLAVACVVLFGRRRRSDEAAAPHPGSAKA